MATNAEIDKKLACEKAMRVADKIYMALDALNGLLDSFGSEFSLDILEGMGSAQQDLIDTATEWRKTMDLIAHHEYTGAE